MTPSLCEQSVVLAPGKTLYLAQLGDAYALLGKLGTCYDNPRFKALLRTMNLA